MTNPTDASGTPANQVESNVSGAVDIAVRLVILGVLLAWCLWIVAPFVGMVVWGMIIAVGAGGFFERVVAAFGGRRGVASTALVGLTLLLLVVPAVMLSETLVSGAQQLRVQLESDGLHVPPPPAKVQAWPLVGESVYDVWQGASQNLTKVLEPYKGQLLAAGGWLFGAAGSAGIGIVQLIGSLILAGVFLARGEGRQNAFKSLAKRIGGDQGAKFVDLANATVRSVVQGIVGVAVIQSVLAGIGFIVAGVPAAGLWALIVLVAAVVQLPVVLVMIPPVLLAYSTSSTTVTVVFTVWCLIVSLLDNVLKPLLFGRGVQVPTVVIFIGAIGGMLSMGIIGLFLGAVVLTLGYEITRSWIGDAEPEGEAG